ncbi:hypothetical protein KOW79_003054 [Hemibagrus wyckioides]|uniref:Uncharacterized protein n=2 Tax=Hemibagrus wyckioides TaxID=337641 RepID=A0A9D3P2G1_9TELE|nr:uncharacterized protein C16orf46 isoform X2 [Hemibagrus wyckioides]XP_058243175.1 uncharacterized protein C16orf46 isoform X2 [Hemibagrus wyckioides]KAG7332919.1 hypothetical protein KOW79_003054 [Hemibagrus wyckioides]
MDADETTESLEKPDCKTRLHKLSRRIVEVLLDISEEHFKEQEAYEIPNQTGWDEAIQGWGQCSSFSGLFIAQQKSKKHRPEISASHCVLCTNLKELKLSEIVGPSHAASEASYEPSSDVSPSSLELLNRTLSTITSTSSSSEEASVISLKGRSIRKDLLGNKLLFEPEPYTPDKLLSHLPQPDAPCLLLKDRNVGKVALLGRVMVLPPVKVPKNSNVNPKSSNFSKRREDSGGTRPVIVSEKAVSGVNEDQEKSVVISYSSPTVATSQGSVPSKQGPTQHQYHLLSALSSSRRYQIPINTMAETQPSANSLPERNLRQEEMIRSPIRQNSGHRSRLGLKEKNLRRAEPELPKLLGTRVQIPVSTQRLL